MKVGIGVPTVGRRPISDGYTRHATRPTLLHIQQDPDRRGPAWARNQSIASLYDAGCDLIVLMDDDCYPVASGWQDYLIDAMAGDRLQAAFLPGRDGAPVGCFVALTRRAIETVGYYSAAFIGYGFEDAHYQHRIARSGIGWGALPGLAEFILSEDVVKPDGIDEYANLTRAEKDREIARNLPVYEREMANPSIYRNREGL